MFQQLAQMGKQSFVYSAGVLLQRVASFLLVPMYTYYLTTADYGQMEILSNTSTVLSTILAMGLISGMYRSYFMYQDEQHRMDVTKTAQMFFIATSLLVIILFAFAKPLSQLLLGDESQDYLLQLVLISIILSNLLLVPFSVLRAKGQSIRYVIYSLIQFGVNMSFTIYFVAFAKRGVKGNFEGLVIGQMVVLLLFTGLYVRIFKAHFSWKDAKEMLTYGLPLMPAMLAAISLTVADRYFLRAFSTFDEIGVYGLGYKVGMIVSVMIVTPFMLSWGPILWSVSEKSFAKQFYAKVLTYNLVIALFVALGLSILSPEVIQIMSQRESYWRAWEVVPLISVSYVLYGIYYQTNAGINLRKKTTYTPFIVGSAAIINLGLNFLLIPIWGIIGAAIATIVSYALLVIFSYFVSHRLYPISYEWSRIIKVSLIFAILLAAGLLFSTESIYLTLGIKFVLILIFPIALLLIRFFTPEELNRARELIFNSLTYVNRLIFKPKNIKDHN